MITAITTSKIEVDHVIPKSQSGRESYDNWQ
ncbi:MULTISPECIES: HNH endonuclease [unclassified Microcoleus]